MLAHYRIGFPHTIMPDASRRLYLIDSSIYVFRAWFSLPGSITDAHGNPANAVYGFADFVYRLLDSTRAQHIGFAFDESLSSSYRNDIYPDYKANRESAPAELKHQFLLCREFIAALGMAQFGSDRYEADDLIGALARREREKGLRIIIVTGDKDLAQLIEGEDEWWEFGRDKRYNAKGIAKHFGVPPEQIADQLAIAGDKVDNIPGVPGIGMATAAKLLKKFGDVDNLLANIEQIGESKLRGAARLQQLIDTHKEGILLARQLTRIHCDAELPADLRLQRAPANEQDLSALFDKLDFGPDRRERWNTLLFEKL